MDKKEISREMRNENKREKEERETGKERGKGVGEGKLEQLASKPCVSGVDLYSQIHLNPTFLN